MTPRPLPVLAAFCGAIVLLLLALTQVRVRTDMTDFLPAGRTEAARAVLDEIHSGAATGLILIGIEGADPPSLARISRAMETALPPTGLFQTVAGGLSTIPDSAIEALFARRYLLADADWSQAGLQRGLERLLHGLEGAAAPLVIRYGLADPPGAVLALLRDWAAGSQVRGVDGAWFAPGRTGEQNRALLLARTKAGGMNIPAQEAAIAAIERAFEAAGPGSARLLVSGPAVFARDASRAIRGDVERLSIVSTLLVAGLLWWRFRSPLVIAAIAAPVIVSVAAAALVVQLAFGFVHGVALGFGATMLGISVDYPVLMLGHRKRGEQAPATRARIARAFLLAVATATIGLAAMIFSGFPGLAQLGLFAAAGLLVCAGLTWTCLPALIVRAHLAPAESGDPAWLAGLERLRRHRPLALVPVVAAGLYLALVGGPRWQGDLAALSPVPDASRALDQELRTDLGAPDAGQLLLVGGPDPEHVLQVEEALLPMLTGLQRDGALAGMQAAALLLPSAARQAARAALIPDRATLKARLVSARGDLPFRENAFDRFLDDAEASRNLPALTLDELAGTPLRLRLEPLLLRHLDHWRGPIVLQGVSDPARIAAAVRGAPVPALFIDVRAELGRILTAYTGRAWRLLAASGVVMLLVLAAGLRDPAMALRVVLAVLAAMLMTVAALTALGESLSLIHLVALQLVAGVGLDYALFFARRQLDAEERARTLRTLVTCNAMTLLTFGLLAFCRTPLLRDIGLTVATGALLAIVSAFFVTGETPA